MDVSQATTPRSRDVGAPAEADCSSADLRLQGCQSLGREGAPTPRPQKPGDRRPLSLLPCKGPCLAVPEAVPVSSALTLNLFCHYGLVWGRWPLLGSQVQMSLLSGTLGPPSPLLHLTEEGKLSPRKVRPRWPGAGGGGAPACQHSELCLTLSLCAIFLYESHSCPCLIKPEIFSIATCWGLPR